MRREKKRKKSERVSKYISPFYNFVAELRMKRKKRKQKLKKSRVLDGFLIQIFLFAELKKLGDSIKNHVWRQNNLRRVGISFQKNIKIFVKSKDPNGCRLFRYFLSLPIILNQPAILAKQTLLCYQISQILIKDIYQYIKRFENYAKITNYPYS